METPHLFVLPGKHIHHYTVEKQRQEHPLNYKGVPEIAQLDINSYQPVGLRPIVEVSWLLPSKLFGLDAGVNATYWLLPDHGCLQVAEIGDECKNNSGLKAVFLSDFAPQLNKIVQRSRTSVTLEKLAEAAKASKLPHQIDLEYQQIVRGYLY